MKHYINTADNSLWAFEDGEDPFQFPNTPETLELIEEERPSSSHIYENGVWVEEVLLEVAPLTAEQKLENAGLTVEELKQLLGL